MSVEKLAVLWRAWEATPRSVEAAGALEDAVQVFAAGRASSFREQVASALRDRVPLVEAIGAA